MMPPYPPPMQQRQKPPSRAPIYWFRWLAICLMIMAAFVLLRTTDYVINAVRWDRVPQIVKEFVGDPHYWWHAVGWATVSIALWFAAGSAWWAGTKRSRALPR